MKRIAISVLSVETYEMTAVHGPDESR